MSRRLSTLPVAHVAGARNVGVFQPDLIMPEQFRPASHARSPEKRLALAVLEHAVDTILKVDVIRAAEWNRFVRDDLAWLRSEEMERPFDFLSICAVLGLDPGYVRRGLSGAMERAAIATAPRGEP
jgi:hypothetical protein